MLWRFGLVRPVNRPEVASGVRVRRRCRVLTCVSVLIGAGRRPRINKRLNPTGVQAIAASSYGGAASAATSAR